MFDITYLSSKISIRVNNQSGAAQIMENHEDLFWGKSSNEIVQIFYLVRTIVCPE